MTDAWVLRLREEAKDADMKGDWYYQDEEYAEFLTQDLNEATVIKEKESFEQSMKLHEKDIFERYGEDAMCNAGYTNMMKNFEWVEVEFEEVDKS